MATTASQRSCKSGLNRRQFMQSLVALGTGWALAGCSPGRCRTSPPINTLCGETPIGLLGQIPEGYGVAAQGRILPAVDVHAHLFNGQDLQITGFLKGPVASDLPPAWREVVRALAEPLARVVQVMAPSGKEELEIICGWRKAPRVKSAGDFRQDLLQDFERRRREFAERLADALEQQEFWPRYRKAEAPSRSDKLMSEDVRRDPGGQEILDLLEREAGRAGRKGLGLEAAETRNVFTFALGFVLPRYQNLGRLLETYSTGPAGLDVYLPVLVDFDYWLGCPGTPTTLHDQVLVMEALTLESGARILPLVAYNPWKDIVENGRSLALVQEAITRRGFVGVKLYPPMGYAPYGNAGIEPLPQWPDDIPDFGARLDERLRELYRWCLTNDVPILAHTSQSQGPDEPSETLAGPGYWEKALAAFPGLRVNAGHFGGDTGYAVDSGFAWARRFIELMQAPAGRNLYADLGYFDSLLQDDSKAGKFLREVLSDSGAGEVLTQRLMYGSDWLMLSLVPGHEAYSERVYTLLKSIDRQGLDLIRRVYSENAFDFLGLRAGAARKRLQRFYGAHLQPLPGWLAD